MARSASPSTDPVYDKDNKKPTIKPDLGKREKVSSVTAEQLERIPTMSDEEGAAVEQKALADLDSGQETEEVSSSSPGGKSFYKSGQAKVGGLRGRMANSKNLKKYIMIGGFGAAIIAAIIALVSFLGVFKLDGLMSSIEQRAFLRNNAVLDTRSTKLMSAYVEMRLMDMGENPNFSNPDYKKDDNIIFRADRVDTNNPFFDWYRTMRASNFEQELFEEHGIKFTSMVTADGQLKPGLIRLSNNKTIPFQVSDISAVDFDNLAKGDVPTIRKFGDIVNTRAFSGNKQARAVIKAAVEQNTSSHQVYKRRALRKAIQNMTGVKDWRFFETTRDNVAQKKIDIRNKIIDKMVPDTNLLGKVTRCLFGVDKCSANRDVASESNHADTTEAIGEPDPNAPDENTNPDLPADKSWDPGQISKYLSDILDKAGLLNTIANLPSTLDMLSNIDGNIKNLVKFVVIARGAQAAGLFQVFETSRDQIKTGQVTSDEVNQFMQVVDTAGNSDGQNKVIEGNGDPGADYNQGACSEKSQALYDKNPAEYKKQFGDYAYLCSDQRIGSAANAQEVQDAYNGSIGLVIHPIASAWSAAKGNVVTGTFISVISWVGNQISGVQSAIVNEVLSVLGLKGDVNGLITYMFSRVSNFLGIAILNGNESGGTMFNWLVQGASYSAESASRQEGAALTTPDSQSAAQNAIALYQDTQKNAALYDRVASLSNPNSLAFRGAMALENVKSDPTEALMGGIHGMFGDLGNSIATIFGHSAAAATPNGYAASSFADIETYDYPPACYNLDPITATPIDGTNALDLFANPQAYGINHAPINVSDAQKQALNSWDTEKDSTKFFGTIYDILSSNGIKNNADDIAVHIYNCNLLDQTVRDSLGYTHGYDGGPDFDVTSTADPNASGTTTTTTAPAGGATTTTAGVTLDLATLYDDSTSVACAAGTNDIGIQDGYTNGNLVKIRLCTIPGFPSTSEESNGGFGVTGANGNVIINSRASGAVLAMFKAAAADGVHLTAISSFRTMTHQQQICAGNSGCSSGNYTEVAKPGTSNHQMGLAIDFGDNLPSTPGPVPGNAFWDWLSKNAANFGYKNYPAEAWHWSPTGN